MTRHPARAGLMALLLSAALVSPAQADEIMKWERIPLQIPLNVGQERVVFVDKNVRVGFPAALNGKLRVQSTGGAVYLKADSAFARTRIQLQDVKNGEVILLDVCADCAGEKGSAEPVRVVYSGDVTTLSNAADAGRQESRTGRRATSSGSDDGNREKHAKIRYSAPIPVLLTRYAAQTLYAPVRTVEAVPGIRPVNPRLPARITTLYPSEPVAVTPLAAWSVADRTVVALRLQNTSARNIIPDPRVLQGLFVAATFQHRWLGPVGTPEDTTTLYLITDSRPEAAFIAEPVGSRKRAGTRSKEVKHGD